MPHHIGMLLYPELTQLDLTGPFEVFSRLPDTTVHLLWKSCEPVRSDAGMRIVPTTVLEDCPQLDVVFVPGGFGQIPLMSDPAVLGFVREQSSRARYVTSVCTGAFVLGAAGLLRGFKATTHWLYVDLLSKFGAEPTRERIVVDGNRVTGAGVTSGLDFALRLATELHGERLAQSLQLAIEYDPAPPYDCGNLTKAPPLIVQAVREQAASITEQRNAAIDRICAARP